ncbi:MAG: hypothetical protein E6L00_05310 [Thaumarchaeota archaeon]|nr:MAG: hypothetical protein E6L00_05310 [Nitrososphaerota archaeon]
MIRAVLVFSFIIAAAGFVGIAHATFSDISLTSPKMVSLTGHELTSLHVGQQIEVESIITNHATSQKKFTYMVQILNNKGQVEYFEGLSAAILPNQSFTVSQSWIPKESGQYTVQTFVWDGLLFPTPLTKVVQTQITVE